MAALNTTTGHSHDATQNEGPKIDVASALTVASQAQGDVIYASSASAWARLAAGTSGQFLQTKGSSANPAWADVPYMEFHHWGLSVSRSTASTVAVVATDLILDDGTRIESTSQTVDITISGAGGLDTGAEAANTIYYIYVIRKSSDGTVSTLLSTNSSSPTMPTDYDQQCLVSCVGNDNSSDFLDFKQNGRHYEFVTWGLIASGDNGDTNWHSIDLTPATLVAFVPSVLSKRCFGSIGGDNTLKAMSNNSSVAAATTVAPNKIVTAPAGGDMQIYWEFEVLTADTLYFISNNATCDVYLGGFYINVLS